MAKQPTRLSQARREEIMNKIIEWREIAESGNTDHKSRMQTANDFANGDQWDSALKAQLESQGKYVATIPLVRANIMQIVGEIIANPKDIVVQDTKGGLAVLARLQSALCKKTLDDCDGFDKMVHWFLRGVTTGDGYLGVFLDDDEPEGGSLRLKVLDEFDCLADPTCETYSLDGTQGMADMAKFFFFDDWVDRDWAERRWPQYADQMESQALGWVGRAYSFITRAITGVAGSGNKALSTRADYSLPDYSKTRYRLTHCWWVEWRKSLWFWDERKREAGPNVLIDAKQMQMAKAAAAKYPDVFRVEESDVRLVHHSRSIGGVLLDDREDEFDLTRGNAARYPVVRFSALFDPRKRTGLVQDMIGPQETLNWLRSMVVNIAKLLPNTGWKIKSSVENYGEKLKQMSGTAAQIIELDKCGGQADKIEPSPFPNGLHAISEISKGEIRETSNIRTENPVQDNEQQSGRAILAKQASAEKGVGLPLRNFDWSLRTLGNLIVSINRCSGIYTDREIRAIVEDSDLIDDQLLEDARDLVIGSLGIEKPTEPAPPNPAELAHATTDDVAAVGKLYVQEKTIYEALMAEIDKLAKPIAITRLIEASRNPIAGKYATSVRLSPYSLTNRLRNMASLLETNQILVESGYPPLPEKFIIDASDLPNKDQLLRERGIV